MLSQYKANLLKRRLLQTLLGGPVFLWSPDTGQPPWTIHCIQLLLWISSGAVVAPWVIWQSSSGLFSLSPLLVSDSTSRGSTVSSGALTAAALSLSALTALIHFISSVLRSKSSSYITSFNSNNGPSDVSSSKTPPSLVGPTSTNSPEAKKKSSSTEKPTTNEAWRVGGTTIKTTTTTATKSSVKPTFSDEQVLDWSQGLKSVSVVNALFQPPWGVMDVLGQVACAGVLGGVTAFAQLTLAVPSLTIPIWFAFLTSAYSLIASPPPEPSVSSMSPSRLSPYARPMVFSVFALATALAPWDALHLALSLVLVCSPVLWLVGLMPMPVPGTEWLVERTLNVLFAEPPAPSSQHAIVALLRIGILQAITLPLALSTSSASQSWAAGIAAASGWANSRTNTRANTMVAAGLLIGPAVSLGLAAGFGLGSWSVPSLVPVWSCVLGCGFLASLGWTWSNMRVQVGASDVSLTTLNGPFALSMLLSCFTWSAILLSVSSLPSSLLGAVLLQRVLRRPWQAPREASLELSLSLALYTLASEWNDLPLLAACVGLSLEALKVFGSELNYVRLLLAEAMSKDTLSSSSRLAIGAAWTLGLPVQLATIGICSVTRWPLFPYFGLPIFLPASPRPLRGLTRSLAPSPDCLNKDSLDAAALAYALSLPGIAPELSKLVKATYGSLGDVRPGTSFLLRGDARTIIAQTLSSGSDGALLSIKALELQETSCHTVEVTAIDDLLTAAFPSSFTRASSVDERAGGGQQGPPKDRDAAPASCLTPLGQFRVKAFSEADASLRGVLDHPSILGQFHSTLAKALTWTLHQAAVASRAAIPNIIPPTPTAIPEVSLNHPLARPEHDPIPRVIIPGSSSNALPTSSPMRNLRSAPPRTRPRDALQDLVSAAIMDEGDEPVSARLGDSEGEDDDLDSLLKAAAGRSYGRPSGLPARSGSSSAPPPAAGSYGNILPAREWSMATAEGMILTEMYGNAMPEGWTAWRPLDGMAEDASKFFPSALYQHIVNHRLTTEGLVDISLNPMVGLVTAVMELVESRGNGTALGSPPSLPALMSVWKGRLPVAFGLDWIEKHMELKQAVLKGYRLALKLLMDSVLYGEDLDGSPEELVAMFTRYSEEMYLGSPSDEGWRRALLDGVKELQSLWMDGGEARVTTLTEAETVFSVGLIHGEAVRAAWASMAGELVYATNDDDERYSIQASKTLLRNLVVQSADAPLGYPVLSSSLMLK